MTLMLQRGDVAAWISCLALKLENDAKAPGRLVRYIEKDPTRLGGEPVFRGTRVPVKSLFDHLSAGD
jgi:hypothetical protein